MEYKVIYSDRKTLSLSVKEGRLIVRAPRRTSEVKIKEAVLSHADWIEKHIKSQLERAKNHPEPSKSEIPALRERARAILSAKTAYFAEKMGLKYGRITITGAKTRFGACSSKGNISYSYRIIDYPEEAIDYVVVHELSHLVEMNHSPRFYKVVESVLPDYKERRKLLKK
ncbi:MAG: M48 family metallopeptidase [Clostridia bacterium]|nr:M48 family metallopeptidase [Clostridia bacterium]